MSEVWNILDRFVIHFTAATSLVLALANLYRYLRRRYRNQWLPGTMPHTLAWAALTVFAISTLREAYDVRQGQSLVKAITDYISWLLGTGFGAWGIYRWAYFTWEK